MNKSFYWVKFVVAGLFGFLLPAAYAMDNPILIGTTGDYPPLSQATESGFVGRDIEIIQQFAKDNQLTIKWVKTSWPNLASDLQQNKFALAVGGISYNEKRAALFYTSLAIESSAKVAMIRCSDVNRFHSFNDIDQESITIVENRGGTNQDFALTHIKNARVIIVKQNESAINSLTSNNALADVMFTDDTEVAYRHTINQRLCQANLFESFPSSPKIFLFAKTESGLTLAQIFNAWWVKQLHN